MGKWKEWDKDDAKSFGLGRVEGWVSGVTNRIILIDDYFGKACVEQDGMSVTLSIEIHSISNNEWHRTKWMFDVIYTEEYEMYQKVYKIVA